MPKIPKQAKRVFKGQVFEIYQWPQKMFDGTTKTFEVAKRIGGISVIATVNNKIIVLKQKQPTTDWYYTIPGGYLDPNENPKKAALRELLEETGYLPGNFKLWKTFQGATRIDSEYNVYIAQNCIKVGKQQLDGGEKIKILYKTFDQFLKMTDLPNFRNRDLEIEMLKARLNPKAKTAFKKLIFG